MCCERHLLATIAPLPFRDIGRILCYHSVGQPAWGVNDVPPKLFRRQIELALERGFRFVPARNIALGVAGPRDLAITFDDGLRSVFDAAAPILADYKIPWSLFVVSEWADGKRFGSETILGWREIEALAASGAEIGSHSATHPDFGALGAAQAVDELAESKDTIERRTGIVADCFAIPLGQSMNWTARAGEAAKQAGYGLVYAQAEETRPAGTIARTFVSRFDAPRIFRKLLGGAFDRWEEWV
jgi:peptidoglycan/xylan/chitin deacetylase (PgdA/CDA1 family)